jgi:hypothetical protein
MAILHVASVLLLFGTIMVLARDAFIDLGRLTNIYNSHVVQFLKFIYHR